MQTKSFSDAALRAIGRNVVNFQRLERCLKALVRTEAISGPMSTVEDRVAKRVAKTSEYTLGGAAREWRRLSRVDSIPLPSTQDLFEPWISLSIELPLDRDKLAEHGAATDALVQERNALMHDELACFDFASETACSALIAKLDDQNARILQQLAFLSPVINALKQLRELSTAPEAKSELLNEIIRQLDSDQS